MQAYYNEFDPMAAGKLRDLVKAGKVAPGVVDDRSITDVRADDLRGFRQCHFFSGIGVWSYALRLAGWADDRSVWTGSCPCQPFSTAGKQRGVDDDRHLWPHWFRLIAECRPDVILGEQVGGKGGRAWFDVVSHDLESAGYAVGAIDTPACSVGAPHIRQRLYWMAYRCGARLEGQRSGYSSEIERASALRPAAACGEFVGVAERDCFRRQGGGLSEDEPTCCALKGSTPCGVGNSECERARGDAGAGSGSQGGTELRAVGDDDRSPGAACGVADNDLEQTLEPTARLLGRRQRESCDEPEAGDSQGSSRNDSFRCGESGGPGPTNGYWGVVDWLYCRDEKWRPVEPGTFPLVDGSSGRVAQLKMLGNAIVAPHAEHFIRTTMEALEHFAVRA